MLPVLESLTPELEQALAALARSWPAVDALVLFGSARSGRLGPESDVDLYVRLSGDTSREEEQRFIAEASSIVGREVDLVVESARTSVILRREVAAKGRPLYERRAGAFRDLRADAIRAYVDLEPQMRMIGAAIRARALAEGEAARQRLASREAARGR